MPCPQQKRKKQEDNSYFAIVKKDEGNEHDITRLLDSLALQLANLFHLQSASLSFL